MTLPEATGVVSIWPVTVPGWIALVCSVAMMISATVMMFRHLTDPLKHRLEELERVVNVYKDTISWQYDVNDKLRREVENQEQASLAIAKFLIDHYGVDAARALMPLVGETKTDYVTLREFGSRDVYKVPVTTTVRPGTSFEIGWDREDAPAPAKEEPEESAPEAEAEEDDAQVIARHERELAEWDLKLLDSKLASARPERKDLLGRIDAAQARVRKALDDTEKLLDQQIASANRRAQ